MPSVIVAAFPFRFVKTLAPETVPKVYTGKHSKSGGLTAGTKRVEREAHLASVGEQIVRHGSGRS